MQTTSSDTSSNLRLADDVSITRMNLIDLVSTIGSYAQAANNAMIREYLPKGSDLSSTSQDELNTIANLLNERP